MLTDVRFPATIREKMAQGSNPIINPANAVSLILAAEAAGSGHRVMS